MYLCVFFFLGGEHFFFLLFWAFSAVGLRVSLVTPFHTPWLHADRAHDYTHQIAMFTKESPNHITSTYLFQFVNTQYLIKFLLFSLRQLLKYKFYYNRNQKLSNFCINAITYLK